MTEKRVSRKTYLWIILPVALFLGLRLPLVVHQPGGMDEEYFAVPGWTVATEGIPRIPYAPTRNPESIFENADRCLMALPPGLFYTQAPFFWILPAGYPTARIPLFLGAVAAIVIGDVFVRRLGGNWGAALVATMVLAASRPLMFTGIKARPDLLCAICGWLAVLCMWKVKDDPKLRRFASAGAACGLGALFHPFALVFCIQCGIWTLLTRGPLLLRLKRAAVLTLSAIGLMSLWAPLIVMYPEEFQSQFFANVLDRAGPGLLARLAYPFPYLKHHAILTWDFFGPWQLPRRFALVLPTLMRLLIPGSGAKSVWIYWKHWGDPRFHATSFIAQVLKDFPQEGVFLADSPYVFDIYLSNRKTLLCGDYAQYWGTEAISYDFLLIAAQAEQHNRPLDYDAEFERTYGSRDLPQSCFVNVYVPGPTAK
jgi:hypothetical protein